MAEGKWKGGHHGGEELAMEIFASDSAANRDGLVRSEVGSEVNLNSVPNTLSLAREGR